jgi:hypothetical protein
MSRIQNLGDVPVMRCVGGSPRLKDMDVLEVNISNTSSNSSDVLKTGTMY